MPGSDVICSTSHSGKLRNIIAMASFCPVGFEQKEG